MSSRGRKVPRGRSPSGVASGRVTISGTTCGWASARARKRRGDLPQLAGPVGVGGVDMQLGQDGLGDAVEQGGLARRVPVEDHRVPVQGAGQAAHGQRVGAVAVDDLQRGGQHGIAGDLAAAVGGAGSRGGHDGGTVPSW